MAKDRIIILLSLLCWYSLFLSAQAQYTISYSNTPFSTEGEKTYNQQIIEESIISIRRIQIDKDEIIQAESISIPLDEEFVQLWRNDIQIDFYVNYILIVYSGYDTEMRISILDENIQGFIYTSNGVFQIDTYGVKEYVLKKIDVSKFPKDNYITDYEYNDNNNKDDEEDSFITKAPAALYKHAIRVLVLFTDAAENEAGTATALRNRIYTDISNANISFKNSGINIRLDLAYIGKTIYTETTFKDDVIRFRKQNDGYIDEVHTLRNAYAADICVLLVDNQELCGRADQIKTEESRAFCIVNSSIGCGSKYTFAHEIGHLIGCRHDMNVDANVIPYIYGHGYVHIDSSGSSWRTMMAYDDQCAKYNCECRRILYWSNPDILYEGIPTGTIKRENNARVWNERARIVGVFRDSPDNRTLTAQDYTASSIFEHIPAYFSIITKNGYHVESGQYVDLDEGVNIQMLPGTEIKSGSKFRAKIHTVDEETLYPRFSKAHNNDETDIIQNNQDFTLEMSPNPTSANTILHIRTTKVYNNYSVIIRDVWGNVCKQVTSSQNLSLGEHSYIIDVTEMPIGIYFVICQFDNQLKTLKLLIQ